MDTVFITGVTGQVGSYLVDLFLSKDYMVYGLKRRSSSLNTERLNHTFSNQNLKLEYGDVTDYSSIANLVSSIKPDLFINCAAMSHVRVSFDIPCYTFDATGASVVNCLEAIRTHSPKTRFITMSSSVSGDTKVLVKIDNSVQLKEIKSLTLDLDQTHYSNLECLTVDDNFNTKWSPVKY